MNVVRAIVFSCLVYGAVESASAATWRGVQEASGCSWARIKISNNSDVETTWTISNCRTATASASDAAETDAEQDWNGVVAANSTAYVWVYGLISGDINVSTAGGTVSGYNGSASLDYAGDGEWAITVDALGNVTADVEAATYSVPAHVGTLPDMTIEQE
jgi:hypothetical protein